MIESTMVELTEVDLINIRTALTCLADKTVNKSVEYTEGYREWMNSEYLPELETLNERLGWIITKFYNKGA